MSKVEHPGMSKRGDGLMKLARILADWAEGVSATVYLNGSRARGDHREDSDVDIHVAWGPRIDNESAQWCHRENDDWFRTINSKLPGRLQILEPTDPLCHAVESAPVIHEERNVKCVVLKRMGPA